MKHRRPGCPQHGFVTGLATWAAGSSSCQRHHNASLRVATIGDLRRNTELTVAAIGDNRHHLS